MPTLQEYEKDYHADDRDFVLENVRKYGTDDRSKWQDAAPEAPKRVFNEDEFARAWGSSGGRTVNDLNKFIQEGGYGDLGITTGGSKGDKVYHNGQFLADAVLAAGLGGQGAQWLKDTGGPAPAPRLTTPGLPAPGARPSLGPATAGSESALMSLLKAVPTDTSFFENILAEAQRQSGLTGMDRDALMNLMRQGQG